MKKYLFLLLFFLGGQTVYTQDEQHPVEVRYEECMEENGYSDFANNQCLGEALVNWDKRLNEVYKELQGQHNEERKLILKESQLKWLKYRDAEFRFIEEQVKGMEGSMYPTYVVGKKVIIVKHRVLELEGYLKYYSTF